MASILFLVLDYTEASHVICGESLASGGKLESFRTEVLKAPSELTPNRPKWATWHRKLEVPSGKGWCVRKDHFKHLVAALNSRGVVYFQWTHPVRPPTSFGLFVKAKWASMAATVEVPALPTEAPALPTEALVSTVGKALGALWRKLSVEETRVWHEKAKELRAEYNARLDYYTQYMEAVHHFACCAGDLKGKFSLVNDAGIFRVTIGYLGVGSFTEGLSEIGLLDAINRAMGRLMNDPCVNIHPIEMTWPKITAVLGEGTFTQ